MHLERITVRVIHRQIVDDQVHFTCKAWQNTSSRNFANGQTLLFTLQIPKLDVIVMRLKGTEQEDIERLAQEEYRGRNPIRCEACGLNAEECFKRGSPSISPFCHDLCHTCSQKYLKSITNDNGSPSGVGISEWIKLRQQEAKLYDTSHSR